MTLKKVIGKIHLWLGLSSGLIVFIIAITGCIYAFQAEIQDATQPYRFVEAQNKPVLPPSQLKAIAEKELPGKKIHAVLYAKPGKAAQVIFYNFEPEYYYLVYMNPYTGEVLQVRDENAGFFRFILLGHFYLWLPYEIGQPVVASATLVFLVMLISGIILWWPKNKAAAKQRFSIKWSARWRRKNYDLHNVLGFYATWIAIILVVTGLVWGFQWFATGLYTIAGGEKSLMYVDPASDTTHRVLASAPVIDQVWDKIKIEHPVAEVVEVHIPETSASSIAVTINSDENTYWKTDYRYFDQYSLKELSVDHVYGRFGKSSVADKLIRMNYDIHVGAIFGIAGKILMFCISLICASLPVTGCYIWWGRRKKKADELEDDVAPVATPVKTTQTFSRPVIRPVNRGADIEV
jgi:uncharacterized iron-regulated membrane protein